MQNGTSAGPTHWTGYTCLNTVSTACPPFTCALTQGMQQQENDVRDFMHSWPLNTDLFLRTIAFFRLFQIGARFHASIQAAQTRYSKNTGLGAKNVSTFDSIWMFVAHHFHFFCQTIRVNNLQQFKLKLVILQKVISQPNQNRFKSKSSAF